MNSLLSKDILSQLADFVDFNNTIGGGRVGVQFSIQEFEGYQHIKVQAPSVSPENMKVSVEGAMLVVSASIPFTRIEEEDGEKVIKEANVPYFFRAIPLPPNVDGETIEAVHEGETLHIKLEYKERGNVSVKSIPIRKYNA